MASAYIINPDLKSGQRTEKEFISYEEAIKPFSKAAEEGRVIWPCPTLQKKVWRVLRPKLNVQPREMNPAVKAARGEVFKLFNLLDPSGRKS